MCKNLETITIPTSVNEIGGYAFSNTKWLYAQRAENTLVIVNNIVADGGACGKSANIPEGTVAISDYAFADCYELADVTIPASVKVIGATSFSGTPWEAKNLSSAGALVINDMHVKGCNKVDDREDIIIEQDKIQNYAFAECEGYKNLQLGGQIKTIGNSAFSALKGLETFELFSPVTDMTAPAVATTAAPTSTTAVTTAAAPVTTQTNGNKVVITLPNVPEGSKIIVIVTNGDTDGNSRIDSSDASAILQEYARLSTGGESGLDSDGRAVSDVDGDGAVSAKDASIVLVYYSYVSTGGNDGARALLLPAEHRAFAANAGRSEWTSALSEHDKQFIRDRFRDKDYVPRSYFVGASPQNDYTPAEPYTVKVTENPLLVSGAGLCQAVLQSGRADSPRYVQLRRLSR